MFLLDLKGTRERSPGSQCRGGPAQGPENDRGKRWNVLGDGNAQPHSPPWDPRTWEFQGRRTVVEPDPQSHPSCLRLGKGLLMALPSPGWADH